MNKMFKQLKSEIDCWSTTQNLFLRTEVTLIPKMTTIFFLFLFFLKCQFLLYATQNGQLLNFQSQSLGNVHEQANIFQVKLFLLVDFLSFFLQSNFLQKCLIAPSNVHTYIRFFSLYIGVIVKFRAIKIACRCLVQQLFIKLYPRNKKVTLLS